MLIIFVENFEVMKKVFFLFAASGLILACNNNTNENTDSPDQVDSTAVESVDEEVLPDTGNFGSVITSDGAMSMADMEAALGDMDSLPVKVKGEVAEVCQKAGCWITLERENGEMMRVKTMDQFFLPKNCSGRLAIVEGLVRKVTTPIEELQHYAKDAGKSDEEIAAISEDKQSIEMIASGIIIQ